MQKRILTIGLSLLAIAGLSSGMTYCGGGGAEGALSGSASVDVSYSLEINIPIADMPTKYAEWVVEVEGYLAQVKNASAQVGEARADIAVAFNLDAKAEAQAIADAIKNSVKKTVKVEVTPPSFKAEAKAECTAKANAEASGKGGEGEVSGEAKAGIEANCEAKMAYEAKPGSVKMTTEVEVDPIVKDNWDKIQAAIGKFQISSKMIVNLDGRGDALNARGITLAGEAVTDLGEDPTLGAQLPKIKKELETGAKSASEANQLMNGISSDVNIILSVTSDKFPGSEPPKST